MQIKRGLHRFFRHHMSIKPTFVVLPVFQEGDVEGAEAIADFLKMLGISRVAAKVDSFLRALDDPRSPKRLVLIEEASARKVMSGRCGESQTLESE